MASIMEAIQGLIDLHKKFGNVPIGVKVGESIYNINGVAVDEDFQAKLANGEKSVFCHLMIDDTCIDADEVTLRARREH